MWGSRVHSNLLNYLTIDSKYVIIIRVYLCLNWVAPPNKLVYTTIEYREEDALMIEITVVIALLMLVLGFLTFLVVFADFVFKLANK